MRTKYTDYDEKVENIIMQERYDKDLAELKSLNLEPEKVQ